MKQFSIVIPVYNSKDYLRRCLDSILNQDFSDYEIILVDDGSNDGSELIVDEYKKENIIVIHEENSGPAYARNMGLSKTSGKYIWFVDSDDEIERDSLEIMNNILKIENPDILFFNYREVTNNETHFEIRYKSDFYEGINLIPFKKHLIRNSFNHLTTCCMQVYKRELIKDFVFPSHKEVGYEDTIFCINAFIKANSIRTCNDIFYKYYIKETGQSKSIEKSAWHIINSYLITKKTSIDNNNFNIYKEDLLNLFFDRGIVGCNGLYPSIIVSEYIKYQKEGHEIVRKILASKEFKEMLNDAKEYVNEPISKDIYDLMLNEDEYNLYHYLGRLTNKK